MMKLSQLGVCISLILLVSVCGFGKDYFPDIDGYETLICDLHTHTVFSDGMVWPTVRVDEAKREGLDAIAISDHIEYQPHKDDLPTNHNRPHEIALKRAREKGVLLIKAAEITRDTPPGHYNALFLDDIDKLDTKKFLNVIEQANKQGAFVFWNHHTWKGEEKGQWTDVQTTMYEKKWLHGMEVANGGTYYPKAHQWCLEKNLTMLGNSDIHDPSINYQYTAETHRTVSLVFAEERSVASIQDALKAGRTAVWYQNRLIGRQEYLKPLFDRSVVLSKLEKKNGVVRFELTNNALINLELERIGSAGPEQITINARSLTGVQTAVIKERYPEPLRYRVKNLLVAPDQGLEVTFSISGK